MSEFVSGQKSNGLASLVVVFIFGLVVVALLMFVTINRRSRG